MAAWRHVQQRPTLSRNQASVVADIAWVEQYGVLCDKRECTVVVVGSFLRVSLAHLGTWLQGTSGTLRTNEHNLYVHSTLSLLSMYLPEVSQQLPPLPS